MVFYFYYKRVDLWKTRKKPECMGIFIVQKLVEKKICFHSGDGRFVFHRERFHFPQKNVENTQSYMGPELVVMLEVISRMMPAMAGSDFRSSSTLRMEERTVAWLRPP